MRAIRVILCLIVLGLVVSPTFGATKEETLSTMSSLGASLQALKANGQEGSAEWNALMPRYQSLAATLGGDDPAGLLGGPGVSPARSPQVAPSAPPGGSSSTATFSDATVMPIVDNTTTTATIDVSGVDPYLWDLDLTTDITHTFASDLEITLTSPGGTTTTISTDNGGSNDDVYSGTLWDDQGVNIATDFRYANGVTATPLVPEGALAAFAGEDPNGTWTLDIFDDAGGDTGNLNSWSLDVTTLPSPSIDTTTNFPRSPALPITDNATTSDTVDVSGVDAFLCDVNLTTDITHTFASDLEITLTSPGGSTTTISTDNGGSNDDVYSGTLWDDQGVNIATDFTYANGVTATPLVPEGALAAFAGEDPNGIWTLDIFDDAAGDTGTLNAWSLDVTTCTALAPEPPVMTIPTVDSIGLAILAIFLVAGAWVMLARRRRA